MKIGAIVIIFCLVLGFLGLSLPAAQNFQLQTSTYKIENPKWGYYKLIIEAYLPEPEESFIIFHSDSFQTILKARDLISTSKVKVITTDEGYSAVLVDPASQDIKVEIDIVDPSSFKLEGNRFSFDKDISGEQLITVVLPSGYGLLEATGIPHLNTEGRVCVEYYVASKQKFPFHSIAAKLK